MPGKQPREGEAPLTRAQSVIAAEILRREFDPAVNTQMAPDRKAVLLTMVNEAYLAKGLPPSYSLPLEPRRGRLRTSGGVSWSTPPLSSSHSFLPSVVCSR